LHGVRGALIVVPVMASAGVVGRYLRRRVLGLPPFPDPAAGAGTPVGAPAAFPTREKGGDEGAAG
ncbi:MAG: hypothetical protein HY784_17050, partial [Chloroflexi bacterium]|nr:hypothetical protein [Chloroflexota bacterium]